MIFIQSTSFGVVPSNCVCDALLDVACNHKLPSVFMPNHNDNIINLT